MKDLIYPSLYRDHGGIEDESPESKLEILQRKMQELTEKNKILQEENTILKEKIAKLRAEKTQ